MMPRLVACLIAIPLSILGADALATFAAEQINFNPPQIRFTLQALLFQLGVGLLVPLIAAAPTILRGTRVAPARVLSEYGISQVWSGAGLLDRLLSRFPNFTRDTLLALRNPFRKRGRLILSLITLTFAGAVFMAIVNLRDSLDHALGEMFEFWRYDAWIIVDDQIPIKRLVNEARAVPGVTNAEAWGFTSARYVRPFIEWDLTKPIPVTADYGYCTDVMEHIPTQDVELVIKNILNSAKNVFFQISTVDDVMGEFIGCPLHLTVKPHSWWKELFISLG